MASLPYWSHSASSALVVLSLVQEVGVEREGHAHRYVGGIDANHRQPCSNLLHSFQLGEVGCRSLTRTQHYCRANMDLTRRLVFMRILPSESKNRAP